MKWWLLHRIHPRHRYHVVHSGLPAGYYDVEDVLLHSSMQLLRRYVESGKTGGRESLRQKVLFIENGGANEPHMPEDHQDMRHLATADREALTIYEWWMDDWPRQRKEVDRMYVADRHGAFDAEEALHEQETEMICRLARIRRCLW